MLLELLKTRLSEADKLLCIASWKQTKSTQANLNTNKINVELIATNKTLKSILIEEIEIDTTSLVVILICCVDG